MRKRRVKILLVIFAPIFIFFFSLLIERIRGQLTLARYKHELIAKGEKLTARDLIVSILPDMAPHLVTSRPTTIFGNHATIDRNHPCCGPGKILQRRARPRHPTRRRIARLSVGEDGKDDGGDASLLPGKTSYGNLWNRKDFIWPSPALPEEVEAYRKEAAN